MATNTTSRRKFRDVAERVASVALIVVPLVVIALWLAIHHKPAWYHPATLDARGMQLARRRALSMTGSISDQMVERKAFDVTLSDESVTRWIAALGTIWPDAEAKIPPELTDIAVEFDDGVVRIAGQYRGSWHAIVNLHIELGIVEDGSKVWVRSAGVYAGAIAIPRSMIARMLTERLDADTTPEQADSMARWLGADADHADGRPAKQNRTEIENRFVWFNGRRPYRIQSIRILAGELRLRIKPL